MCQLLGASAVLISEPNFTLNYSIHTDVKGAWLHSERTTAYRYAMAWRYRNIHVSTYAECTSNVDLHPQLHMDRVDAMRGGYVDLAHAGFEQRGVHKASRTESRSVVACLLSAEIGHNVFTRLVRVYLRMMYAQQHGFIDYQFSVPNIPYRVANIAREYDVRNANYIYVCNLQVVNYLGSLVLMCQQYPINENIGYQHINMVGDSNLKVVSRSNTLNLDARVRLSCADIESALLRYA